MIAPSSNRRRRDSHQIAERSGFTLVEMLIAVALTLLIMTLFAQIFEMASGSITLQQALGENDQQVRTFTTLLRSDLQKRTYRGAVPFLAGQADSGSLFPFGDRRGYFYVSTNDPNNPRDTVLQFTLSSKVHVDNSDETEFFGKAAPLDANFRGNRNQPEHDDGQFGVNQAASSTAAQVCYFLRSGRLYRRVILLRDPWHRGSAVQPTRTSPQPDADFFDHASPLMTIGGGQYSRLDGTAGEFWDDFDFAAYSSTGAKFLGIDALHNDGSTAFSLGIPGFRFGFDQASGISREFSAGDPTAGFFLGRYTHEETSHSNFNFPQTGSNKFSYTAFTPTDDPSAPDGVVDQFANGPRRGADLLLSHVHSFEVQVWDSRLGRFAALGHSEFGPGPDGVVGTGDDERGDFHIDRNRQLAAGLIVVPGDFSSFPASWRGRVFDTWHPSVDIDTDGVADPPPYRPLVYYPTNTARSIPAHFGPLVPDWEATPKTYAVGDRVFPQPTTAGTDPGNFDFHYECITAGNGGINEPSWPRIKGGTTIPADPVNDAQFVAVPNIVPVASIEVQVRFLHIASNKIRQLTLVHSLTDDPL